MGKDARTIRQEIEQTRERMGDTVEALAYKTDVSARVKDTVNDRVDAVKDTIGDVVENVKTAVAGASETVKTNVAGIGDTLSDAVDQGSGSGKTALERTRNTVKSTRKKVNKTVGKLNDGLSEQLQNVDVAGGTQRAVGLAQENPIGLALAALAVGFLTGSLIPVSEAERSRLKPIGDRIADQAQAATSDLVAAGKAVMIETAQGAVAAALGSAKSHGAEVVDAAKSRADQS